jgi:hypothetical protein
MGLVTHAVVVGGLYTRRYRVIVGLGSTLTESLSPATLATSSVVSAV